MSPTLVSIICTVKNGEKTISKTIESVLNQTYQDFEFIIIDDGSGDKTYQIIKEYIEKDNRIIYQKALINGRGNCLRQAVSLSKGQLIANIDADDLMHPQRIEIQVNMFNNNKDIFLVSTDTVLIFDDQSPEWDLVNEKDYKITEINNKIYYRNTISHPSVMMRKDLLILIGNYSSKRKTQIDYELWLRAKLAGLRMIKLNYFLCAKRIHSGQSFENKNRKLYIKNNFSLQVKFILKTKKIQYIPIIIFLHILSRLPFGLRRKIERTFKYLVGEINE